MNPGRLQRGFLMLPVVICLTLLAAVAYMMSRDAGMGASLAGRGLDADSARYIAEAGLARMNYDAQNADCVGYPALSSVAFGAGQFSASATPTSGSPVTLTATATLPDGGAATLTRANVRVYRTTPFTVTLQPATLLQDSFIESNGSHRNDNNGGDPNLRIGSQDRSLLRFDLSSIPSTAIVQSAQMMLYKTSGGAGPTGSTITAYPLTRAWVEGDGSLFSGVTWNTVNGTTGWTTSGGDYNTSSGVATASIAASSIWVSWELAPIVANWVSGATANQGVILIPSGSVPDQAYMSGDGPNRVNTPKLIVTYRAPCDWTPPPVSVTLTSSADSYIDKNTLSANYGSSASIILANNVHQRGLFQFDVSSVAPGTLVTNARLRLYVTSLDTRSGSDMFIDLSRLTSAWSEGAVSWLVRAGIIFWVPAGGDFAAKTLTQVVPNTFNGGWIEFDITALAQAWVDGILPNYGVILQETTSDRLFVAGKEAGTVTAPQLVLTY